LNRSSLAGFDPLGDIMVKGKGLEPLCDALERLSVERIRLRPEKYEGLGKSEGIIEEIEVKKIEKES
jgi:hypothetical protein